MMDNEAKMGKRYVVLMLGVGAGSYPCISCMSRLLQAPDVAWADRVRCRRADVEL